MRHKQTLRPTRTPSTKTTRAVHLNLPLTLAEAIAQEAEKQYRTATSLICQTLAEAFQKER